MNKDIILEMKNITKSFSGVVALDNVDFSLRRGEIHALMGENGAGKSTLIKILSGAHQPDSGEIRFEGKKVDNLNPRKSEELGIGVIYQEHNLVLYLTIAENIFLGNEKVKGLFCDDKRMDHEASSLMKEMGIELDPRIRVQNLSVAYKQMVEIAKALSKNAKVLIMDEPTAPLSNVEVEKLFELINALKNRGVSIIYISHRIEEVFSISDRITVIRDGSYIGTFDTENINRQMLIKNIVGRELTELYPQSRSEKGNEILRVEGLTNKKIKDISFSVYEGEILGIGGLVGAGRTETARAIYGADRIDSGKVFLNGVEVDLSSPKKAVGSGVCLLPEDRKIHGLLLKMSVGFNMSIASLKQMCRGILISNKLESGMVEQYVEKLRIKCHSIKQIAQTLSGGNQQKVIIAKWLASNSLVFIFDEPTRGVDVGTKQEIYELLRQLAAEGKAVIVISSEMPELLGVSDRIIVMHEGRITGEIANKSDFNQELVLEMASGES